ncbi:ParB/RepB/Spo0J family partition protein [Sulfurirhabdus autotrophica]|uniref:ParB-like chromosome segregation protein Spo0J n=1 Tax=Sulfurirhabdus autotrophica TaxID=1706046 RepID=A0A4R3Y3L0_9PROT|nr:ParB N-terminal domain-containing protein [Sulfurirhabdus autotrophica]TCV86326.1 ParB-like chromosome segregation protein Spo0J [Sulfurirhabdus autotrophica]
MKDNKLDRQLIPIDLITRDTELQVRNKMDTPTIRKYAVAMRSGAEFPPISLAMVDGTYLLLDGWHRLAAARELGEYHITALVKPMTREVATWEAAKANLTHGLPLKATEKLSVFKLYMKSKQNVDGYKLKSYRKIEIELAGLVPRVTLTRWVLKYYPATAKRMGQVKGYGSEVATAPDIDHEPSHLGQARQALSDGLNLYLMLDNPTNRGELIKMTEDALKEMKQREYVKSIF